MAPDWMKMMKRLMILGGSIYVVPVIERAHELGIYVITCDFEPDNIAHKYSDQYCYASTADKDAVLECAKKCNINGIISFACDSGVVTAAYVAEKLGLPFQCSYESAQILQDKGLFRKFLSDNNFQTPRSKRYIQKEEALKDIAHFRWPIIVKPVDSAGSKGVTKVDRYEKLDYAIDTALKYSRTGAIIIEDFLTFKGYHSSTDVFTINGKISFISYSDQLFDNSAENPYKPAFIIWPTTMDAACQKTLTCEIQRLFDLLRMSSGIYNIETCVGSDGTPYIMEVSPRGGGCRIAEIQKLIYGVDLIDAEVKSALGISIGEMQYEEPSECWCELVIHPEDKENGIFDKIILDNEIRRKYIKRVDLTAEPGALIQYSPTAGNTLGDMFLKCPDRRELDRLLSDQKKWLKLKFKVNEVEP